MSIDSFKPHPQLADSCNVAYALQAVGGKWKISIIWELASQKPQRLSSLRRNLVGISEGVLITQLKNMEQDGLVRRIAYPELPPHVEYELTNLGQGLIEGIKELEAWGGAYRHARQ